MIRAGTLPVILGGGANTFRPPALGNLAAWYDVSDRSSLILDGSLRCALVGDKSGNSAVNCLITNGVSGNYASVPNAAALQITGDIDIRWYGALPSWTPSTGTGILVAKWTSGGQGSFIFYKNFSSLGLTLSTDGSTVVFAASSVDTGFAAFSRWWVRVTWRASDGRVQFFTSADGISWTQLGTNQTIAIASIFASTTPVTIGARNSGASDPSPGAASRVQIFNGIAGTNVLDVDFSQAAKLASSFVCATGQTVTINTSGDIGARISGERDLVQLTDSKKPIYSIGADGKPLLTFTPGNSQYIRSAPFALAQPFTRCSVAQQYAWASGKFLFGGGSGSATAGLVQTTSTPQLNITAGSSVAANTDLAVGMTGLIEEIFNGASSSLRINRGTATTGNAGTGVPNGLTVGADGASTAANFSSLIFQEQSVYSVALDTTTLNRFAVYAGRKWGFMP